MAGFLAGLVAGVTLLKIYEYKTQQEDDDLDDDGKGVSLLNRSSRSSSGGKKWMTASMASQINNSGAGGMFYNEAADETGGICHVNFLSDIAARLWPYLSEAATQTIRDSIEPTFKDLPRPLNSLKFTKLELGDVPVVLDNIMVKELFEIDDAGCVYGTNRQYLQFEWDITWKSTCNIQLATDKIAHMTAVSFGVKTFEFSGRLQVIVKPLSEVLPCADAIQFAFVNPPVISLDFTGLANLADMKLQIGGFNILDISGIVRGLVSDTLAQSMVLPNRTIAPLKEGLDYRDIFVPSYEGLARVKLHSGRGFEIEKAKTVFGKDDIPDVYVKIRLGAEKFFVSSVVDDNCNPVWDPEVEFENFLFCAGRNQILEIQAWDEDTGVLDHDDQLGIAHVTLGQVLLEADRNGLYEIQLMKKATKKGKNDTPTGQYLTISLERIPFSTKDASSTFHEEVKKIYNRRDRSTMSHKELKKQKKHDQAQILGIATILVSHATDLPFKNSLEANTFVKVFSGTGPNKIERGVTPTILHSLNPEYQTPIVIPLTVSLLMEYYNSPDSQGFTFEMFQQDSRKKQPTFLGGFVVENEEIVSGDSTSIRDSRWIGKHKKTQLSFTITLAGIAPTPVDGRVSNSSIKSIAGIGVGVDGDGVFGNSSRSIEMTDMVASAVLQKIRVRIVRGYGFVTESRGAFRKPDIPDVYCIIKYGSSPSPWRTPTIKNSETPEWDDEYKDFSMESMNEVISIDVWDENRKGDDDYYGNARTSVGKVILSNGFLDVEVKRDRGDKKRLGDFVSPKKKSMASKSALYIRVQCQKL